MIKYVQKALPQIIVKQILRDSFSYNFCVFWYDKIHSSSEMELTIFLTAKFMGQHVAHLGPIGPSWAPCWPHEPCDIPRLYLPSMGQPWVSIVCVCYEKIDHVISKLYNIMHFINLLYLWPNRLLCLPQVMPTTSLITCNLCKLVWLQQSLCLYLLRFVYDFLPLGDHVNTTGTKW